jgi:hypothetical protein
VGYWSTNRKIPVLAQPLKKGAHGRNIQHPSALSQLSGLQKQVGKQEMGQMINAELRLEAILSLAVLGHHDTGIIDENVDFVRGPSDVGSGLAHRGERVEVRLDKARFDARVAEGNLGHDGGDLGFVAADEDQMAGVSGGKIEESLRAE